MIILACETSTLLGSVALFKNGKLVSSKESVRQGSHSEVLNVFVEQCLKESGISISNVDLFVTGIGPGSFTGIRISLNTIKTFSYCFDKPCLGIDSLFSLAFAAAQINPTIQLPIVAMINAYKNMVYTATYRWNPQLGLHVVKKPSVQRVQRLPQHIDEKCLVVGDGYQAYEKYFSEDLKRNLVRNFSETNLAFKDDPTAATLGQIAYLGLQKTQHWSELVPVYLRDSEAEENAQGIKYEPLF